MVVVKAVSIRGTGDSRYKSFHVLGKYTVYRQTLLPYATFCVASLIDLY